ncbi:MAG: hypothetical protein RL756_688 [Pseudomonadota bacterium]|jgi:hypothetical protein
MPEYNNDMTGIIGKNDRKESDKHPDIKGHCEIGGVKYWISGWRKERKDGSGSFYSLRYEAADQPAPAKKPAQVSMADDDSIPF